MTKSILLSHILFVDIVSWPYGFPHWNKIYFKINAEKISPFVFDVFCFVIATHQKFWPKSWFFFARSFFCVLFGVVSGYAITNTIGQKFYHFFIEKEVTKSEKNDSRLSVSHFILSCRKTSCHLDCYFTEWNSCWFFVAFQTSFRLWGAYFFSL